ncbi:hypothetical protein AMECASPLE_003286 [Ameca splendens]|uniref:Uncharacterized protein n=1 Tax=Ameca splendens TaxID=208324 RepID=A0ABV0XML8_9TELE
MVKSEDSKAFYTTMYTVSRDTATGTDRPYHHRYSAPYRHRRPSVGFLHKQKLEEKPSNNDFINFNIFCYSGTQFICGILHHNVCLAIKSTSAKTCCVWSDSSPCYTSMSYLNITDPLRPSTRSNTNRLLLIWIFLCPTFTVMAGDGRYGYQSIQDF